MHSAPQTGGQRASYNQLTLQPRRQLVPLRESRRQVVAMSLVPLAQLAVVVAIVVPIFSSLTLVVPPIPSSILVAIVLVFVVALAVTLALRQRNVCAPREQLCSRQHSPFVCRHAFSYL